MIFNKIILNVCIIFINNYSNEKNTSSLASRIFDKIEIIATYVHTRTCMHIYIEIFFPVE